MMYFKILMNFYFFTLLLFVVSCNEKNKNTHPKFEDLSAKIEIKNVKLNTQGGYKNNQIFERPIDHSSYVKDSKTGVYLPLIGDTIKVTQKKVKSNIFYNKTSLRLNNKIKIDSVRYNSINEDSLKKSSITNITRTDIQLKKNQFKLSPDCPKIKKVNASVLNQNYSNFIEDFTVQNGLVDSDITDLLIDNSNNLWISTTKGLSKFDGEYFCNYSQDNGLASRIIQKLFLDSKGNIWIGTMEKGIIKYDGNHFISIDSNGEILGQDIWDITEDKKGNIWIASNHGLFSFKENTLTSYDFTSQFNFSSKTDVISVEIDLKNNLWISFLGSGVLKFDGNNFYQITEKDGLNSNKIWNISVDNKGDIWFGDLDRGVSKLSEKKITTYLLPQGITKISFGENDNVWLSMSSKGVVNLKNKELIDKFSGLTGEMVCAPVIDNGDGLIFIGIYNHGLSIYKDKNFKTLVEKNGLNYHEISQIKKTNMGGVLLTYWSDNIKKSGFAKIYNDSIENFVCPKWISSIYEDGNTNNFFIGLYKSGFYFYDRRNLYTYLLDSGQEISSLFNGHGHDEIVSIEYADSSNIWIITSRGLYKLNWVKNEIIKYHQFNFFDGASSVLDLDSNLWIASEGKGLYKIIEDSVIQYTEKEGLTNNWISCISLAKDNGIWIGTESGELTKYIGGQFFHLYNLPNPIGDSDSSVLFVLEDLNGNIWFANYYDLYSINLNGKDLSSIRKNDDYSLSYFNYKDGFNHKFLNPNNAIIDNKNILYYGSSHGLTKFKIPLNKKEDRYYYKPKLIDLKINDKRYSYASTPTKKNVGFTYSQKKRLYNIPENLVLNHNYNQLEFNFVSTDWTAQHKVKYLYKIEDYDTKWYETQNTTAQYKNIPPGNYIFKVYAVGPNKLKSKVLTFSFKILNPWYLSHWAKISYIFFSIGLIYLIVHLRTLRLKTRQKELEVEVDKATRENINLSNIMIEQEKIILAGEIAGTVAHELNTPLGAIVASSKGLKENYILSSDLLKKSNKSDIDFAFSLEFDFSSSIFKSGRKSLKMKRQIFNKLIVNHGLDEENATFLSDWLFKARINIDDFKAVDYIINSENSYNLLRLINAIANTKELLTITMDASKRSAQVIKEIKQSLDLTQEQKNNRINLKKNILTVVKLFSHEIKDSAELILDIEEDVYIIGWDFKLYQLWSNLIKNAIYAVNEKSENRKIKIYSKTNNNKVQVIIENNGPKISDELSNKIFEKFYTTKKYRGSGLGLGIVKGVVEAHQADISFYSEETKTQFQITFSCV